MHAHIGLIMTSVSKCPRCPQSITNVHGPAHLCLHKYPLTCILLARLSSLLLINLKRGALWDSYVDRDQQAHSLYWRLTLWSVCVCVCLKLEINMCVLLMEQGNNFQLSLSLSLSLALR